MNLVELVIRDIKDCIASCQYNRRHSKYEDMFNKPLVDTDIEIIECDTASVLKIVKYSNCSICKRARSRSNFYYFCDGAKCLSSEYFPSEYYSSKDKEKVKIEEFILSELLQK